MTAIRHDSTRHDQPSRPNPPCPQLPCPDPLFGTCNRSVALERNLVVHVAALATRTNRDGLTRLRTGGAEIAAARLRAEVATTTTDLVKHLELRIEALQHDLGRVAVLPVLVLPLPGLQRALKIHLRAFL